MDIDEALEQIRGERDRLAETIAYLERLARQPKSRWGRSRPSQGPHRTVRRAAAMSSSEQRRYSRIG